MYVRTTAGLLAPASGVLVRNQDAWRILYRRNRYLEHADQAGLFSRTRDIITNITGLTYEGKIDLLAPNKGGAFWIERFTHVLEEMALRGIGFPDGLLKNAAVPKPSFPVEPRARKLIEQLGPALGKKQYVAKLGKARYLEPAFKAGLWRISPASTYAASDPSLGPAQRDDELEMSIYLPKARIKVWDGKSGKFKGEGETLGNVRRTSRAPSDYYVSCMTKQLDLRLFDDFGADCCIVVDDHVEFARRVFAAARKLLPSWHAVFRDVRYVDPYLPPKEEFYLFSSKDFKYSYQKEVRFAWIPEGDAGKLDHLQLEIGDISDISRLAKT
jgi:hypothetical protein